MRKTRFILPNAFTSMSFLLGTFSICWAAGIFSGSAKDPFRMSAYFTILCVLLDKLDGFAARLVDASSEFGAQFDSLADLVAFGLAPAFALFFHYKVCAPQWLSDNLSLVMVVFSVYVLCAAMRLAKYNAMDSDMYHEFFSGLPSTFAGGLNVVFLTWMADNGLFTTMNPKMMYIPLVMMLLSGILMVSPFFLPKLQIRKNKIINAFQVVNIIAVYIAGFMFIAPKVPFTCEYMLLLMAGYIVIGFGYGFLKRTTILEEGKKAAEEAEAAKK